VSPMGVRTVVVSVATGIVSGSSIATGVYAFVLRPRVRVAG
jgi:hypothetical protein